MTPPDQASRDDRFYGRRVRFYRQLRGMRQDDLGAAIGRDGTHISMIESGKRSLRVRDLVGMAAALNVSADALLLISEAPLNLLLHDLDRAGIEISAETRAAFDTTSATE